MTGLAATGGAMDTGDDQVTRTVSNLIRFFRDRRYEPGERLPSERDLATRFKVARGVVREALKSLEWMRYIDRKPNSGIFLRGPGQASTSIEALVLHSSIGIPFGAETDLQCLEVRKLLEVQAIRLACERRTDANVAALRGILAQANAAEGDGKTLAQLDYAFHMQVFEATQNDILVRVVTPFYLMSETRRQGFFADPANFRRSQQEHERLIAAIAAGEAGHAADLMADHIGRVEKYFADRQLD